MNSIKLLIILLLLSLSVQSQEKTLKIEGVILDASKLSIPYAAISIPSKYVGTSSNEDGNFYLELSKSNLLDTLEVSSIGYVINDVRISSDSLTSQDGKKRNVSTIELDITKN